MMSDTRPTIPIWRTVTAAYRTGIGCLFRDGALFRYFLYASLLTASVFALHLYRTASHLSATAEIAPVPELILGLLLYIGYAVVINPFAVAVHRKILLGETPRDPYLLGIARRPQQRFLLATVAVYVMFFLASSAGSLGVFLIYGLNPFDGAQLTAAMTAQPFIALFNLLTWGSYLLVGLVAARLAFAFPGIAIDAPGASLRQSMSETQGSTWRLFFVFLFIFLGVFIIVMVAYMTASAVFMFSHPEFLRAPSELAAAMAFSPPFLAVYAVLFVIMMVMIAVVAAAAARAYEIRVNQGMSGVAEVFA